MFRTNRYCARANACVVACLALVALHGWAAPPGAPPAEIPAPIAPHEALAAAPSAKPVAAIYEFRSSVTEVGARAATDMFVTALVRSGRFRVVERARINEGVIREKQLSAQGLTEGDTGQVPLKGVRYLFEGTVSEANASQDQRASGISIGGMEMGSGSNHDVIAIDVRVLDAVSGEILDVVTVRRDVNATNSNVSGVGNLLVSAIGGRGRGLPVVPDVHVQQQHRDSIDEALRSAIEEAVRVLAAKLG